MQTTNEHQEPEPIAEIQAPRKPLLPPTRFKKYFLMVFDRYGEAILSDPGLLSKSWVGALISIFVFLVFLALLAWSFVKLFSTQPVIAQGEPVVFNIKDAFSGGAKQLDYPALFFNIRKNIIFYESERPNLQKIDVVDRSGYGPRWTSRTDALPTTSSIYTATSIPLNSFDADSSRVQPIESRVIPSAQLNVREALAEKVCQQLFTFNSLVGTPLPIRNIESYLPIGKRKKWSR
jgi:hypothetical protein